MHRVYIAEATHTDRIVISDKEQLHHIRDVARLKINDEVVAFDSKGNEYACVITGLDQKQAVLAIKQVKESPGKTITITIACAMPKKSGMDDIVDSLTQLGVDAIIPMETERVVVRLDDSRKEARLRRWRKIALGAAEQSQRSGVPLVEPVTDIRSVIARSSNFDLKLIPALIGERKSIKEVLGGSRPESILVMIGPEGDFTPEEVEFARDAGFVPVSLGDNVLRVGTAATAVVSFIRFLLGD